MADVKSLKYIDLASITTLGASISFIFSIIIAIILLISSLPTMKSFEFNMVMLILAITFTTLIFSIPDYFGRAYLFNFFAPKFKDINIEIVDMDKITNISVISLALTCSIISLIITLIVYPGMYVGVPIMSFVLQLFGIPYANLLITLSNPIILAYSFVLTFILVAISTLIFNLVSPRIGGLKLGLTQKGDLTQINSINIVNLALILSAILAVIGLVIGLILSIVVMNLVAVLPSILYLVLGGFVLGFIIGALIAMFYNFLAPKMGGLKIRLV